MNANPELPRMKPLPIPYAQWNKSFFQNPGRPTRTRIYRGQSGDLEVFGAYLGPDGELVYDSTGQLVFDFFVSLRPDEVGDFLKRYHEWASAHQIHPHTQLLHDPPGDLPPSCGTPSTPSC
jgi:hypothetical protein